MTNGVFLKTNFPRLNLINQRKVRDVYDLEDSLLIVATDRLSAFDVILPNGIPYKGKVLNQMSLFWFSQTNDIVCNHVITSDVSRYPSICIPYADELTGRSVLVRKARPLKVECIVRGYLSGSGWKDYQKTGAICGIPLPAGLKESDKLPEPIFTPSTKAEAGEHDENISFERACQIEDGDLMVAVRYYAINCYLRACEIAEKLGIIIADTKMEFGLIDRRIYLIDELFTPDSSRFWPMDKYVPGRAQESLDKQPVRDYLESIGWDKKPPAPNLPIEIVERTTERYLEAYRCLTGKRL